MTVKMFFFSGVLCLTTGVALAQNYPVSDISETLLSDANAVIRKDDMQLTVDKANEVWISHQKVITILNVKGKYDGIIRVNYNKSRPLRAISATLYDASGKIIRKYKKRDFEDVSNIQAFSLFEDDREKRLLPSSPKYPYTIAYSYQQKYKFSLYFPKWIPDRSDGVAIEKATFQVVSPSDFPLRYYSQHLPAPQIAASNETTSYTWRIKNKHAIYGEPFSPPLFQSNQPLVMVSPVKFAYYGLRGTFHNWKEYGTWVYTHLLSGRDELPESTIARVRKMTKGLSSPREIARKIYNYVQRKNRYISIQVGKGGFQPMEAAQVDAMSYGDCKALVNYTMALLKVAGIPSYYTEVYAGDQNISLRPEFASAAQGNHIILCVPFGKDTTWLECTDKYTPFGYLGSFTDNRNVVVCTPKGGVFTRTPAYADTVNRQIRTARFTLDSLGNLQGKMTTCFTGFLYEQRQPYETLSRKDKIERVVADYSFLQMNVNTYRLSLAKSPLPYAEETITFNNPRYAAVSDQGLNIPLDPISRIGQVPAPDTHRTNKVYISRGYVISDTVHYILPPTYHIILAPKSIAIQVPFGSYQAAVKQQNNTLSYVRTFRLNSGLYDRNQYNILIRFLRQASRHDRASVYVGAR